MFLKVRHFLLLSGMTTMFGYIGWLERRLLLLNTEGFILNFSLCAYCMLNLLC